MSSADILGAYYRYPTFDYRMSDEESYYSDEENGKEVELGYAEARDVDGIALTARSWTNWDGGKLGGKPVSSARCRHAICLLELTAQCLL